MSKLRYLALLLGLTGAFLCGGCVVDDDADVPDTDIDADVDVDDDPDVTIDPE